MTSAIARITIDTPIAFGDELPDRVDVAVIGAGVIGIFSALFLARRGMRVMVLEKGRVAGEQSSRNWGWIRQQGRDHAELPIMMDALRFWHEVNRETNGACGVRTCGTTYLARSEAALSGNDGFLDLAKDADLDTRHLTKAEIEDLFSNEGTGQWIGAVHTPSDACGEPWQAVPAVARLAQRDGALIREQCAVRAFDIEAGRLAGIVTEHGKLACDQVVVAAGAWSSLFMQRHGVEIPQLAVRSTVAKTVPLPEFFSGAAADEKLALRRRQDGGYSLATCDSVSMYLGPDAFRHARLYAPMLSHCWRELRPHPYAPSGYPDAWHTERGWSEDNASPFEEHRVLEPHPKAGEVASLSARFKERFPRLGAPRIEHSWAGMIDAMPDVVPVVDRVPGLDGVILATGMSGHGFGIGPGFGKVIAGLALNDAPAHDLRRFRFGRFTDGSKLELGPML